MIETLKELFMEQHSALAGEDCKCHDMGECLRHIISLWFLGKFLCVRRPHKVHRAIMNHPPNADAGAGPNALASYVTCRRIPCDLVQKVVVIRLFISMRLNI